MSLQVDLNNYGYINRYTGYSAPAYGSAAAPASCAGIFEAQEDAVDNIRNNRLMKKMGVIECNTCRNRRYVDGSADPGVSFKTPTHVSPEDSAAAVMSHEREHVLRERINAQMHGRKVVAQSVRTNTEICPECGRVYTSGGKTITTTKADNTDYFMNNMRKFFGNHFGKYIDKRV